MMTLETSHQTMWNHLTSETMTRNYAAEHDLSQSFMNGKANFNRFKKTELYNHMEPKVKQQRHTIQETNCTNEPSIVLSFWCIMI